MHLQQLYSVQLHPRLVYLVGNGLYIQSSNQRKSSNSSIFLFYSPILFLSSVFDFSSCHSFTLMLTYRVTHIESEKYLVSCNLKHFFWQISSFADPGLGLTLKNRIMKMLLNAIRLYITYI